MRATVPQEGGESSSVVGHHVPDQTPVLIFSQERAVPVELIRGEVIEDVGEGLGASGAVGRPDFPALDADQSYAVSDPAVGGGLDPEGKGVGVNDSVNPAAGAGGDDQANGGRFDPRS